jgi:hypothetical protein
MSKSRFPFFKGAKKANLKPPEPRTLDVITKEYNQECWELGQLSYQVDVLNQAIREKNAKIMQLNREGDSRKKLDAETKKQELPNLKPAEATNEQRT